jgi:hypothetical protein
VEAEYVLQGAARLRTDAEIGRLITLENSPDPFRPDYLEDRARRLADEDEPSLDRLKELADEASQGALDEVDLDVGGKLLLEDHFRHWGSLLADRIRSGAHENPLLKGHPPEQVAGIVAAARRWATDEFPAVALDRDEAWSGPEAAGRPTGAPGGVGAGIIMEWLRAQDPADDEALVRDMALVVVQALAQLGVDIKRRQVG